MFCIEKDLNNVYKEKLDITTFVCMTYQQAGIFFSCLERTSVSHSDTHQGTLVVSRPLRVLLCTLLSGPYYWAYSTCNSKSLGTKTCKKKALIKTQVRKAFWSWSVSHGPIVIIVEMPEACDCDTTVNVHFLLNDDVFTAKSSPGVIQVGK